MLLRVLMLPRVLMLLRVLMPRALLAHIRQSGLPAPRVLPVGYVRRQLHHALAIVDWALLA